MAITSTKIRTHTKHKCHIMPSFLLLRGTFNTQSQRHSIKAPRLLKDAQTYRMYVLTVQMVNSMLLGGSLRNVWVSLRFQLPVSIQTLGTLIETLPVPPLRGMVVFGLIHALDKDMRARLGTKPIPVSPGATI